MTPEPSGYRCATPGDTGGLYVGANKRVEAFIYRRDGPKKPSVVIATWEGCEKAGPLLISMERRADGGPLRGGSLAWRSE